MKNIIFTKKGFDNLSEKLNEVTLKRPSAVKSLSRAREMGDLSENGLYKAAKFELSDIDRQIRFLKNLIKYGQPVMPTDNNIVQIGHNIVIENENGKKYYQIVGEYEANPKENKISFKSPLGQNLLGKKLNDKFEFNTPNGLITYKILSIAK